MSRRSAAITASTLILAGCLLTGCATEQHARADVCPPNKTLVCQERMGQVEECKCHSKATLRDIFDLRRSRP